MSLMGIGTGSGIALCLTLLVGGTIASIKIRNGFVSNTILAILMATVGVEFLGVVGTGGYFILNNSQTLYFKVQLEKKKRYLETLSEKYDAQIKSLEIYKKQVE